MTSNKLLNPSFYRLTKDDTGLVKAIGILAIVMHNFLHAVYSLDINQMQFDAHTTYTFLHLSIKNPLETVNLVFVYFGHYGVQLFIFISAYGLTKKHMNIKIGTYIKYLADRLVKIYGLLIVGLLFLFVFLYGKYTWEEIKSITLFFLSMTGNFQFYSLFAYVGPWWFFSLIIQFYILFPLLFSIIKRFRKHGVIGLFLFSYILIYALLPLEERTQFPIFANIVGHLPNVMVAIYLAMFPSFKLDYRLVLCSLAIFVASHFVEFLFPFNFLAALIVMLYLLSFVFVLPKEKFGIKILLFVGKISMFMFLINSIVREKTIIRMYYHLGVGTFEFLLASILHTALVILLSYILYLGYRELAKPIKKHLGISIL